MMQEMENERKIARKKYAEETMKAPKWAQSYLFSQVNGKDVREWTKENWTASKWRKYLEMRGKENENV